MSPKTFEQFFYVFLPDLRTKSTLLSVCAAFTFLHLFSLSLSFFIIKHLFHIVSYYVLFP